MTHPRKIIVPVPAHSGLAAFAEKWLWDGSRPKAPNAV